MTLMTAPPLDEEDDEMLVPHSELVGQAEAVSAVENQPVEDPPSSRFSWTIENFSRLNTKKLYSDVFMVGSYKWRVLIFPKGNNVDDHLSLYLGVADSANLANGWSRNAQFSLAIVNQVHNKYTVRKDTQHQFTAPESDWGFTSFMPLNELYDPGRGYLVNDTCIVEAEVVVCKVTDYNPYTIIKVARNEDLLEQIGKDIYFDLVDHDKVRSFRIQKRMPFNLFKEEVAKEFGIPVQLQRFWLWAKRQNHTYRPNRPLTQQEETQSVGQFREVSNKAHNAELKLFLEVELGLDLRPIPPPDRAKEVILLFFKLYDPEKEELRYVGRLFVKGSSKPLEILKKLNEMAGFDPDEELELYEEIKFEPSVMCEHIDKKVSFRSSELEDGDILCFQKPCAVESQPQCRYPDVPSFLEDVHNRQVVHFRSLKKPKEDDFCLELSKLLSYDDVTERVAKYLGLDDPTKLRLTPHNCYSHEPKPRPIKYQGVDQLSDMLGHYNQTADILYYEVLDIPLPELQGLKTLKVAFYHPAKEEVVHTIRLPNQSTVDDVINDLKTKVELSHPDAELRVLEVFYHKIYKIFPLNEKIENINDQYWTLRAEEIPEEEKNLGPHDCLIHVYHFTRDPSQSQMQVQNFGDPFILVIHEGETLAEVKVRIQKKLEVSDDEFAKWKFAFLSVGRPEYLQDSDVVSVRFQSRDVYGAWEQYLGLEHSDSASNRAYTSNQVVNHMQATRNYKPSRGIEMQNNKLSHSNFMEAQPQPVPESDLGNLFNDFMNSTQTRVDVKRNEPVEVLESLSEVPTREYPNAGQLYEGGRHHPDAFDEKFEDIGGFSILKTQASTYKQIWLKYGHIASSQVITASYIGQVAMVAEIMKTIIEMNQHRLPELSLAMIDSWDEKIKMVEVLKFNVKWFRERFEDVKKDFYGGEKLKTLFVEEKLKTISDAKSELVVAEEQVTILQDKLKMATEELKMVRQEVSGLETSLGPLLSERQIYLDKSKHLLLHGLF